MKKILSVFLVIIMIMMIAPIGGLDLLTKSSALEASGKCGKNLTYTFNSSTGLLTISGKGAMYDFSEKNSPFYHSTYSKTVIKTVVINDGVTSIGNYAFYDGGKITSVTIPNSVTSIGNYAFYYCDDLTKITIPNSVTSIGIDAFYYCKGLTSITIPKSIKKISKEAFYFCKGLISITIENGVTSIGDSAFKFCNGLISVTVPDSVTSIGNNAFGYCECLSSVTLGSGVTSIGNYAFGDCASLTSITIPDSVTSIGNNAFTHCECLSSVTLGSGVTSIGNYAFWYCDSLTSITIPDSVTSIGEHAFCNCTGLTSITIPDSVKSIGFGAFSYCSCLTSITISDSVMSIGIGAFNSCYDLKDIYYTGTEEQWNIINGISNAAIPSGVEIHYDYSKPHVHSYKPVVTQPTCTAQGFTTYTCSCGDTYVDNYVKAKGHTDGEWKVTKYATYTENGIKTLYCKDCGVELRTEKTPYITGKVLSVSINDIEVNYKSSATITPEIEKELEPKYTVKYETSNSKIATVDDNGNITTHGKGTATITCTVTDEGGNVVKDTCTVNVNLTFGQWLIWILLLGFLWY